jgi:hypothetical protein
VPGELADQLGEQHLLSFAAIAYDPRVRCVVVLALLAGCRFEHGAAGAIVDDAAPADTLAIDAAIDAAVALPCPADTHLRLCYSFDQNPLPGSLPNEGAATVSATLTNVTRADHDGGGAAQITTASTIHVAYTAEVANIQALEVEFRPDVAPLANLARIGLIDSNVIPPNISLFWYRNDPGYQLRCGIGSALFAFDAAIQLGAWHRVLCTCNSDTLQVFVNGTKLGEVASAQCSSGGALVAAGLTIGSNNNGGPTGVTEWLTGTIDNVRLWDVSVAPSP